jgi:hypothetical protein
VEYLLSIASTKDGLDTGSAFFLQSRQLAGELLSQPLDTSTSSRGSIVSQVSDSRLLHLKPHPDLHTVVTLIRIEMEKNYLGNIDGGTSRAIMHFSYLVF